MVTSAQNLITELEPWTQKGDSKHIKILIVEDDVTQAPLWTHILGKADPTCWLEWATNVAEALHILVLAQEMGEPFDLVISDIYLSGSLTGIDLWRKSYQQQRLTGRMILVSSMEPMKMIRNFKNFEAPTYLKKPLNIKEAITTVYDHLPKRKKIITGMIPYHFEDPT